MSKRKRTKANTKKTLPKKTPLKVKKHHSPYLAPFFTLAFVLVCGTMIYMMPVTTPGTTQTPGYEHAVAKEMPRSELQLALAEVSSKHPDIDYLIEHIEDYPEWLLNKVMENPEIAEFAKDYPTAKKQISGKLTNKEIKDPEALILQWDKRWGYMPFGDDCLAFSGCGPTCIAMVSHYLKGENYDSIEDIAEYAETNGYYIPEVGTDWSFMTKGARHFGLYSQVVKFSEQYISGELEAGHPIICSVGKGDFSDKGHFIVLEKKVGDKYFIRDPYSKKHSETLWDFDVLAPQINGMWSYRTY